LYTVCCICSSLKIIDVLDIAVARNIPLVLIGSNRIQGEKRGWEYEMSTELIRTTLTYPADVWRYACRHGFAEDPDLGHYFRPDRFADTATLPRVLAPFHAWNIPQEALVQELLDSRLVRKRSDLDPIRTNCRFHWLLQYADFRRHGYNPYLPEFARLVRAGEAPRHYWLLRKLAVDLMFRLGFGLGRRARRILAELGMSEADLRLEQ
jgi:hypothetical protein